MTVFSSLKTLYSFLVTSEDEVETTLQQFSDPEYWGKGVVSETIKPFEAGRVEFKGSWWPAISEQGIILATGTLVQVIGRHNITLIVQPIL